MVHSRTSAVEIAGRGEDAGDHRPSLHPLRIETDGLTEGLLRRTQVAQDEGGAADCHMGLRKVGHRKERGAPLVRGISSRLGHSSRQTRNRRTQELARRRYPDGFRRVLKRRDKALDTVYGRCTALHRDRRRAHQRAAVADQGRDAGGNLLVGDGTKQVERRGADHAGQAVMLGDPQQVFDARGRIAPRDGEGLREMRAAPAAAWQLTHCAPAEPSGWKWCEGLS